MTTGLTAPSWKARACRTARSTWCRSRDPSPAAWCFTTRTWWAAAGLTEEDIPETYSEFREVARILTEAGNGESYGIVEGAAQIDRVWVDLACWADYSGGFYMTEDYLNLQTGMPDWNTQEIYDLMQLWADLYAVEASSPTAQSAGPRRRAQFANGQAGMIIQGWWNVGDWSVNYPDLNFGVFAPPVSDTAYENGVKGFFPVETPTPFMGISANCEYPEIAADYLMNVTVALITSRPLPTPAFSIPSSTA